MLTVYLASRHHVFTIALLVAAAGCTFMDVQPPEIAKPLGYDVVEMPLPDCSIPLPPVRDSARCGATEIGKSIEGKDVCRLLVSRPCNRTGFQRLRSHPFV